MAALDPIPLVPSNRFGAREIGVDAIDRIPATGGRR